jgi:hypothetical protein
MPASRATSGTSTTIFPSASLSFCRSLFVRHKKSKAWMNPSPALEVEQAIAPFPRERIFSANEKTFLAFDRQRGGWNAIAYEDMIPMRAAEPPKDLRPQMS